MAAVSSRRKKARIEEEAVIPEDVSLEILKMLPPKSLLRFRCACKTWYSVISDPEFCNKLHQKRAAHVLICRRPTTWCSDNPDPEFCNRFHQKRAHALRPHTFSTVTTEESSLMNEKPLSLPWQPEPEPGSKTKFLGSCNGLVCVYHKSSCPDRSGLFLWNPSTRKFRKLPLPPAPGIGESSNYTGFGYDEQAGDYKLVWLLIKPYPFSQQGFYVLSLKSKTWSGFNPCQPSDYIFTCTHIRCQHPGVLSNGTIHWIVSYKDDPLLILNHIIAFDSASSLGCGNRIFAFDLASETYRLLEFPQECESDDDIVSLSLLSGFLCCLYTRKDFWIDLWMMKEYGVDSSWRKFMSFPISIPRIINFSLRKYPPIQSLSEEGNLVAIVKHFAGRKIIRLKVEKGAIVSHEILLSVSYFDDTIVFKETLASPN